MEYDLTELAWAAGFFDGEGSVSFIQSSKLRDDGSRSAGGQVRIQLTQVRKEPLERFQRAVGLGSISGPHQDMRRNHNATFKYVAGSNVSFSVCWNLLGTFLCAPKQEQFHQVWCRMRDHYASADVRRNDPRRLPPEPVT